MKDAKQDYPHALWGFHTEINSSSKWAETTAFFFQRLFNKELHDHQWDDLGELFCRAVYLKALQAT